MRTLRRFLWQRPVIPIVLVTLLTLGLVSAVVLTTTSLGCSVAQAKSPLCVKTAAHLGSPSPTPTPGAKGGPIINPSNPPYSPAASSFPPYDPAASAYPPYNPGSSPGSPYTGPSSGSTPPLANPSSGSSTPGVALSCRLPVYANGPGSGGFIVFPGNTFVADPRSAVTAPSPSPGSPTPQPGPYGGYAGWFGSTYDAKYSKWLPVPWRWVSPDGTRYAYPLNGDVYVQSVTGGAQLDLGEGQRFSVLDVENDGVYVTQPPQAGLWFLPFSGAAKQIIASGFWQGVSHGAAYGTVTSAVPQGATNTIIKLDLQTGASVSFFDQPGGQSGLTGFDGQGHPTIQVNYPQGVALFLATGPGAATPIASTTYGYYSSPFPQGPPIPDSHGLWFTVGNGVILFANGQWYWMSSIGGQLAGQCQ